MDCYIENFIFCWRKYVVIIRLAGYLLTTWYSQVGNACMFYESPNILRKGAKTKTTVLNVISSHFYYPFASFFPEIVSEPQLSYKHVFLPYAAYVIAILLF